MNTRKVRKGWEWEWETNGRQANWPLSTPGLLNRGGAVDVTIKGHEIYEFVNY
jgi:hypothetical protein